MPGILWHTTPKQGGTLFTDNETKPVFTKESPTSKLSDMTVPKTMRITPLTIRPEGVEKLLRGLKLEKASCPDNSPNRILKELSHELLPAVTALFTRTLDTVSVPKDWTDADISPIFKKGNIHLARNYRPVPLTCTRSKFLEHIICKHTLDHLETNNILMPPQHGFHRFLHTQVGAVIEWAIVQRFSNRLATRKWMIESETKFW